MAENDRTEDQERQLEPTQRRLEKAREEGQFPQARDLSTLLVLSIFLSTIYLVGSRFIDSVVNMTQTALRFGDPADLGSQLQSWAQGPLTKMLVWGGVLIVPLWFVSLLAPFALVQFRPVWAFKFRGDRVNPITGLGRIWSSQTLLEAGKSLLKVSAVFLVGIVYVAFVFNQLGLLARQSDAVALQSGLKLTENALLLLLAPIVVIAAVDVTLQWFSFQKRMRMTQEELRKELKETEGSPELRARLRQRQRQLANSRMMAALERADVVITNPEHYAVALRYDPARMVAPVVVAKGIDDVALRIQTVAKEFSVPIARVPPLARLMHSKLRLGQAIPSQLFEAVAQVLAWAYDSKVKPESASPAPEIPDLPDSI